MVEVFLTLENDFTYELTILTPQYLTWLMKKDKINFIEPDFSFIIVKKLTRAIISEVIEDYVKDNAYWLRLHYFEDEIPLSVFEDLETIKKKETLEFEEKIRQQELQLSNMEPSEQGPLCDNKKLSNNRQVIPRLLLLTTMVYLGLLLIGNFKIH